MKFSIKKVRVYPKNEPIKWDQGVYLGASINNTMLRHDKTLMEMLDLISENTNEYSILLGDYLHRYNEQIFGGYNENQAIEISLEKGRILTSLLKITAPEKNFKLISTGDLVKRPLFAAKFEHFENLYASHARFRDLVDYTINVFLRRQNEIKIPLEKAKKLCLSYLIEELAIFELLAEDGLGVNIYPGNQLPIMKEIVTGNLKQVSETLETIQIVEIKFRPINC